MVKRVCKLLVIIVLTAVILLSIISFDEVFYYAQLQKIDSFSDSLLLELESQYQLKIPDNVKYVEGWKTNHPRVEDYMILVFQLPQSDQETEELLKTLFVGEEWHDYPHEPTVDIESWDIPLSLRTYDLEFSNNRSSAFLQYTHIDGNNIQCCLIVEI